MDKTRHMHSNVPRSVLVGGLSAVVGSVITLAAVIVAVATGSDCPPAPWSDAGLVIAMAGVFLAMLPLLMPNRTANKTMRANGKARTADEASASDKNARA